MRKINKVKQQLQLNVGNFEGWSGEKGSPYENKYKNSHYESYKSNLYNGEFADFVESSFAKGNGSELKDRKYKGFKLPPKMCAVHSSSAFAVNLFGCNDVFVAKNRYGIPEGKYSIGYEVKLPTIKSGSNIINANIDVCLSRNNIKIYIETKLTEPITYKYSPNNIKSYNSYSTHSNYLCKNKLDEIFILVFKKIHESKPISYDSMQMLKHLLGICNDLEKHPVQKVLLINCHCANSFTDAPNSDFQIYGQEFLDSIEPILKEINKKTKLSVINLSHKEMMEFLKIDDSRKMYLKRYDLD